MVTCPNYSISPGKLEEPWFSVVFLLAGNQVCEVLLLPCNHHHHHPDQYVQRHLRGRTKSSPSPGPRTSTQARDSQSQQEPADSIIKRSPIELFWTAKSSGEIWSPLPSPSRPQWSPCQTKRSPESHLCNVWKHCHHKVSSDQCLSSVNSKHCPGGFWHQNPNHHHHLYCHHEHNLYHPHHYHD